MKFFLLFNEYYEDKKTIKEFFLDKMIVQIYYNII